MALLNPYPTDIVEPSNILWAHFRGEHPSHAVCLHAAYQLQGVVMGKLFPDPPVMSADPNCPNPPCDPKGCCDPKISDEDCCKVLSAVCAKKGDPSSGILDDLTLKQLLAIAMKYLLSIWGI
jgi:hypothetical protein